jgi:hypothetical protein
MAKGQQKSNREAKKPKKAKEAKAKPANIYSQPAPAAKGPKKN